MTQVCGRSLAGGTDKKCSMTSYVTMTSYPLQAHISLAEMCILLVYR